jgi:hypothetical protein
MALACVLGIFFGDEEQDTRPRDATLQTNANAANQRPRCITAEKTDFWLVDLMGRI